MKNIHIPNPCPEKWEDMTPSEKGAICGKCATEIIDFTKMTDDEVKDYLRNANGARVCAKMKPATPEPKIPKVLIGQSDMQGFRNQFLYALIMVFGMNLVAGCQSDTYNGPVGIVDYEVGDVEYVPDSLEEQEEHVKGKVQYEEGE